MAGLFQLRTYTLKTTAAAAKYAPLWIRHKTSLQQQYGVKTLGVYKSRSDPRKVIAVVEFQAGDDPDAVMKDYASSQRFKEDMQKIGEEGVGKGEFESVESVVLEEVQLAAAGDQGD